MKGRKTYRIDIYQLKNGLHEFTFPVDKNLFDAYENSPVETAHGTVQVRLDKQERLLVADLEFDVEVPLICDRTLKEFDHHVGMSREIVFKYGEEELELDENMVMITRNTQEIDLQQFIYEFICVDIPMKKIHPDHRNEEGTDLVYTSGKSSPDDGKDPDDIDPRWSQLKNLK